MEDAITPTTGAITITTDVVAAQIVAKILSQTVVLVDSADQL